MKPRISIALITLGLTFPAPVVADNLPITPERQYIIDQLERNRKQESSRWREFGAVQYDWKGWKRSADGTHTTTAKSTMGRPTWQVAVTCTGLRVSKGLDGHWGDWELPDHSEEQMLIELCSQIPGAPKAAVRTAPQPKTCTGNRIDCASRL